MFKHYISNVTAAVYNAPLLFQCVYVCVHVNVCVCETVYCGVYSMVLHVCVKLYVVVLCSVCYMCVLNFMLWCCVVCVTCVCVKLYVVVLCSVCYMCVCEGNFKTDWDEDAANQGRRDGHV